MLEGLCRSTYEKWCIDPLLKRHWIQKIPPLKITQSACLIGISFFPLLIWGSTSLALIALFASGFLDTLDGSLARLKNQTSAKGAVCDIICDRIVELTVVLALYAQAPSERGLLCLLMLGSMLLCITSFLVVGIFSQNTPTKSFYYSPGLIERAEAFLFFAAMALFPTGFAVLATLFTGLVLLTAALRVRQFLRN